MRKVLTLLLLSVLACTEERTVNGLKLLVVKEPFSMMRGLKPYDEKPLGRYDGMVFVFPVEGEYRFHARGFRHSVLLCNFEDGIKRNCVCLLPGSEVRVRGKVFVEELHEGACEKKVRF